MAKYSLGMQENGMDLGQLAQMGQGMLASGRVTPEEVAAAQLANENPDKAKSLLDNLISGKPGKGTQKKTASNSKDESTTKTTKNLYQDVNQFASRANDFENLEFMKDQKRGITEAEDMLSMAMSQKRAPDSDYWIRPLAGLADAETGGNISKSLAPRENSADRLAKMMKAKDDIQEKKSAYSKQLLDGLTKMKEGTETNSSMQQLAQQIGMTQGMLMSGKGAGMGLTPFEEAADKKAGASLGDWQTRGGFTGIDKNIGLVEKAIADLEASKGEGGMGTSGRVQGVLAATGLQKLASPGAAKLKQDMNLVATEGLKSLLPGAISDYESRMIQSLSYDPSLPEEQNIEKLNEVLNVLKNGRKKTEEIINYSTQNRSIRGMGDTRIGGGAPPPSGDKVTVINPQGQKGKIPRSQLASALANGYKEAK